ncbi:MAG TPA: hypothetical protein VNJ01_06015 [Bacteriovoracaceae bacterium]|nr:hypothetical protein [Bacteriovoracaceae bacterium]
MTWNFKAWFTHFFFFSLFTFMAVHFAHMKSPSQYREIASQQKSAHPWYDASFKL